MKKGVLLLAFTAALIVSAGCVAPHADTHDPLIGNWVCGEYTNSAGMHYTKVYETFYPDNTGIEKGYVDDGSITRWEYIWLNKGNGTYEAYYNPLTFTMSGDGMSGVIDSTSTEVQDWRFTRISGENTVLTGTWEGLEKYHFMDGTYNVSAEIYADGTGLLRIEEGQISMNLRWNQVGSGMYVIALSQIMYIQMNADGTYSDNFGCVFHRV
ncbi:MAG: hypothetical protein Q4Q04_00015 [Methanocorpusculum sp.]|nr:hypothetical protein [Methanocorpusculum sp.]